MERMEDSNNGHVISNQDENKQLRIFPGENGKLVIIADADNHNNNKQQQPKTVHRRITKPTTVKPAGTKGAQIYSCEYCPLTFKTTHHKDSHVLAAHLRKPKPGERLIKPCEICGAMISSRNFSKHKREKHGLTTGNQKGRKFHKFKRCATCLKIFRMGSAMRKHLRESKECGNGKLESLKCPNCKKIFCKKFSLQRHMAGYCKGMEDENPIKIEVESD